VDAYGPRASGPYNWHVMAKLTIEVPDDVAERVADAAAERGVASEELVGQVLAESFPSRRHLSFIAMGRSGRSDTAERHKEIIAEALGDKHAADV
jgi:hypothetical protein